MKTKKVNAPVKRGRGRPPLSAKEKKERALLKQTKTSRLTTKKPAKRGRPVSNDRLTTPKRGRKKTVVVKESKRVGKKDVLETLLGSVLRELRAIRAFLIQEKDVVDYSGDELDLKTPDFAPPQTSDLIHHN